MRFAVAVAVFVRGGVWLAEDLINCLFPLDIPAPLPRPWTGGDDN